MRYPLLFILFVAAPLLARAQVSLEEEIYDFFHDPEISGFDIAPGGSNVSYAEYFGKSRRSLITIDFEKGEKRGLEAGAGADIYSVGWVGPDRLVYARAALHGSRLEGMFSCKSLVTDIERLDSPNAYPRLVHTMPHDPKRFAAVDLREVSQYRDLMYYNLETRAYDGRVKNPGKVDRYYLDTKGEVRIARSRGEEKGELDWLIYDSEEKSWSTLKIDREVADWKFIDDGEVVFAELQTGARVEIQRFHLGEKEFVGDPIGSEIVDVTVDTFIHDPSTLAVHGLVIEEPTPRTIWFDEGLGQLAGQLETVFKGSQVLILGANAVSNSIFFEVKSDVNPGSLYSISKDGKITPLGFSNSKLVRYKLSRTAPIEFENREGVKIRGFLTLPQNADSTKMPLLVVVHGGPHSHDTWYFDPTRQFFAYKGFAVLNINYRGSSGYGKAFWSQDGFGSILQRSIDDVIDGTRWAMENENIDPNRVAIMGGSYGGYAAMEAIAREPELYRCGIGFAGVYDWPRILNGLRMSSGSRWDWFYEDEFGDLKELKDEYASLSPAFYPERIKVPVLLIHGKADGTVPDEQSKRLHKAINKVGGSSNLILDTWGRHGFIDEERRVAFYTQVLGFLEENTR